ncbi:unnamed protein product, partial [Allacma fusca]
MASPTTTQSTSVFKATIRSTATTTAPATQTIPDYDGKPMLSNSPTDMEAPSTILGVGTIPTKTPRTATIDMRTSERSINGIVKNAPEPKSDLDNMASTLSQGSNGSSVFENWIILRILL